ncbi:MAG: DUF3261 domain-containing protein [Methylococcaceae bacterium]|nr:DUF3261 domain-containing protein [Methylococcaceae bacterium]
MPRGLAYWLLSASFSASLVSCSLLPITDHTETIDNLPLAQPNGPSRRVVQQIKAIWQGHEEVLMCVLELDNRHIAMAGLSTDGVGLFNLYYDGKTVKLDKSPLLPESVSPELVIKDLQLAYWPLADLQKILPKQWRLVEAGNHRQLYFDNELTVDVAYLQPDALWAKTISLTNHRFHYQLHIKTISYESLPE